MSAPALSLSAESTLSVLIRLVRALARSAAHDWRGRKLDSTGEPQANDRDTSHRDKEGK